VPRVGSRFRTAGSRRDNQHQNQQAAAGGKPDPPTHECGLLLRIEPLHMEGHEDGVSHRSLRREGGLIGLQIFFESPPRYLSVCPPLFRAVAQASLCSRVPKTIPVVES
jgi:hypothetical protein